MTENTDDTRFGGYTPCDQPDRGGFSEQWVFRFDNGFGASVVRGPYTYGGSAGLYELAVVEYDGDKWELTYATPITDDVIGHLSEDDVTETLRGIEALPPANVEQVQA